MAKNRFFYYDHENARFVEVKERTAKIYVRILLIVAGSLLLSIAIALGMDRVVQTPQELGLIEQVAHYRLGVDSLENYIERQADTISRLRREFGDTVDSIELATRASYETDLVTVEFLYQEIAASVEQYDAVFREIERLGIEETLALPLLQSRVDQLEKLLNLMWGIVGAIGIAIVIGAANSILRSQRSLHSLTGRVIGPEDLNRALTTEDDS